MAVAVDAVEGAKTKVRYNVTIVVNLGTLLGSVPRRRKRRKRRRCSLATVMTDRLFFEVSA